MLLNVITFALVLINTTTALKCPTCKEAGKGDDPYLTGKSLCPVCLSFSGDQTNKIKTGKRYHCEDNSDTSCDESDLPSTTG